MHTLLLLGFLQLAQAVPLRSGCSPDEPEIAAVQPSDPVEVRMALAGEQSATCYKVVVTQDGKRLGGYVLGETLPAVDAFVHHREKVSAADSRAVLPPVAPHTPTPALDPKSAGLFPDFSGRDPKGRAVSLSGLDARVIIVSFWSPGSKTSQNQLTSVLPLYNQFHRRGLAAVGISMDPDPRRILPSLDDVTIPWPQISDRAGLATHYDVDPRAGKTFVLDASHHIIASGTMGPQMEATIRNLLFPPEI